MPPTRIRATCPGCGEVELTPPDVELRVCREEEHSFYAFVCPECYQTVTKPADRRVVRLLTSGGVPAQPWDPPSEVLEPRTGPRLTWGRPARPAPGDGVARLVGAVPGGVPLRRPTR